jgi:adiponectin receptor
VDHFLTNLEHRLDHLEKYGNLKFDQGIERAWSTLQDVRSECGRVGGEVIDEGKRRARAIVEILESRYHEALEAKDTLPGKVAASVHFLDELLDDFEGRAQASLDRKIDRAKRGMEAVVNVTDKLTESIERAIALAKEQRLITYEELPVPWRVNPHILRGYRFTESKIECVKSAFFSFSNETCNIWTHGLGFIMVLSIAFYFYPTSQIFNYHTTADKLINGLFFLAAAKAMACSTIWHTFAAIAHQDMMERFACVDYSGISLLIAMSIITTEYTAFYNEPLSRWIYMSATFLFGIAGVILPWRPIFNRADMRVYRVAFYVSLAATGMLPMVQLCFTRGTVWVALFYGPVFKSVLVYLIGATFYACQVPERWFPGCFDWVGGSHNIFHCMVVCGILFHWYAMHDLFHLAWGRMPVTI